MGNGYREGERAHSVLINQVFCWETVLFHKENLGKDVKHVPHHCPSHRVREPRECSFPGFSVSAWTEGPSVVWTKTPQVQRWRYWQLDARESTLARQDEKGIREALMTSVTNPHNEFRERLVSRPVSR